MGEKPADFDEKSGEPRGGVWWRDEPAFLENLVRDLGEEEERA